MNTKKWLTISFLLSSIVHVTLSKTPGYLELHIGSMYSGKSGQLVERIKRWEIAKKPYASFKHSADTRQVGNDDPRAKIISRTGSSAPCIPVTTAEEMEQKIKTMNPPPQCIAVDEVQFFADKKELFILLSKLAHEGKYVVIAGLDTDFRAEPFGAAGDLCACADEVHKLKAVCSACGTEAYCHTQRLDNGQPAKYDAQTVVVEGSKEAQETISTYEPRCRNCFQPPKKDNP